MTERVSIDWEDGTVSGRLAPGDGDTGVLLAHGAGAGQDHEWMTYVRDGLAASGHPVLTFNYPYTEAGRRAPNPARILLACHRAALEFFTSRVERVVLAGKSMGGRMGSHLAAEGADAAGVVFYGYPLVGIGKTEPRDVSHLSAIDVPMLFVQGTRDRLAPLDLIRPLVDGHPRTSLHVVEDGDHSFKVPKRTGRDVREVLDEVVGVTAQWIAGL